MPKLSVGSKEREFYALFQQEAENLVKMAQQLKNMVNIWQNVKEMTGILSDMEQDGDAITHNINKLVYRSFVTPFDREDIVMLANTMDDIADRIHSVADTLYLYRIESPTARAREFCDLILQAVQEVEEGVLILFSKTREPGLHDKCVAVNQIENSGDVIYRNALVELFDNPADMTYVIKWREVYKHMESAIDGCEVFANMLESIAAKNT